MEIREKEACYKLVLTYDGQPFSGWQVQPNRKTIQQELQSALSLLIKEPIWVTGSGRTDAGVHALGQVAHFHSSATFSIEKVAKSLNGMLYPYIQVISLEKADRDFHARYSAKKKTYVYSIWNAPYIHPLKHNTSLHIPYKLKRELMRSAARRFVGTHDFTSFANVGTKIQSAVRTIYHLDLVENGPEIQFIFVGSGFLYKMVRNISGALIQVGSEKLEPNEVDKIFAARDRRSSPRAAPAHGLTMVSVNYQ